MKCKFLKNIIRNLLTELLTRIPTGIPNGMLTTILIEILIGLLTTNFSLIYASPVQETKTSPTTHHHQFSLRQLIHKALLNAPELQILGEKEYQSNMEVQKTKSITKPNIDLVVGHMYQSEPDIITDRINRELKSVQTESLDDYAGSNKTTNKFQLDENSLIMGVAFRQFIYASGLFSIQVDLQRQQLEQTQFKRRIIEEHVIAKVIDLFFQIHFGQQKLKLLKDINDLANKTYNIIIQKHDSGQLHQTDLTRSHINKFRKRRGHSIKLFTKTILPNRHYRSKE